MPGRSCQPEPNPGQVLDEEVESDGRISLTRNHSHTGRCNREHCRMSQRARSLLKVMYARNDTECRQERRSAHVILPAGPGSETHHEHEHPPQGRRATLFEPSGVCALSVIGERVVRFPLACSLLLRLLEKLSATAVFPDDAYEAKQLEARCVKPLESPRSKDSSRRRRCIWAVQARVPATSNPTRAAVLGWLCPLGEPVHPSPRTTSATAAFQSGRRTPRRELHV
jgi:hypothetical protein